MSASIPEGPLAPRVLVGAWCTAIVQRLSAFGVSDIVISPGSRNTPLTASALRATDLRCHSVLDERSAGFFALGLARGARAPVALLCTSGTAGAHYFPALIEASYDGVPLVILTADRPEELHNCGAPQTITQGNLFGDFARKVESLPAPIESTLAFANLGGAVDGLLCQAQGSRPGPVHLNVPLRKPLEPDEPRSSAERARYVELVAASSPQVAGAPALNSGSSGISATKIQTLVSARRAALRPLLTAGPLPPADQAHFRSCASLLRAPTLEEYGPPDSSGLEFLGPCLRGDFEPDLLVHFGPPAVSSSWARYLEDYRGRYFVFSGTEFRDPSRRAEHVVTASLQQVADALEATLSVVGEYLENAPDFVLPLRQRTRDALHDALSTPTAGAARLFEPHAVAAILSSCRADHALVLGNSLSLRLASWVWSTAGKPPHPYTARGVNGIDGMIAWSLGVAVAIGKPTVALMGDVTAAHDIGSLQLLAERNVPLVLVVLDNSGGRIFDHLPVRRSVTDDEMHFWTTTPRVDFSAAAAAFGVKCLRISTEQQLKAALSEALQEQSPTLIVAPTDPDTTAEFLTSLRQRLEL